MRTRTSSIFSVAAAAIMFVVPALAQHIPPHSNDPHPPANQPAYQLPSPGSLTTRPGIPGYPNAPHSNDPHYRRTEPNIAWPKPPPAASSEASYERLQRAQRRAYIPAAPRVSMERRSTRGGKARTTRQRTSVISLDKCYSNWDAGTRMSRASWNDTCRRLAVGGRVSIR